MFRFIETEKAHFPVAFLCRSLGVSSSGYYAWRKRPRSARGVADAGLSTTIRQIHAASRGTYGAPRIHAELAESHQTRCSRKRVARLMRAAGWVGVCRRRVVRTTRRDAAAPVGDDLVRRQFTAPAPNRLWVADITYLPTGQGFLYLAVVLDVFSRRVVGWAMADHLRTELVLDALEMAVWNRRPAPGLVHHSDHGCQYTSLAFGQRCRQSGIARSMGSVGDCYDSENGGGRCPRSSLTHATTDHCVLALIRRLDVGGRPALSVGPRDFIGARARRPITVLSADPAEVSSQLGA